MPEQEEVRDKVLNTAIDKLMKLTGEDFHGYRSEVWGVFAEVFDSRPDTGEEAVVKEVVEFLGSLPSIHFGGTPLDAPQSQMHICRLLEKQFLSRPDDIVFNK